MYTNTKLTATHLHEIIEKDVSQFEISVNDLVLVQVLDAEQNLVHEVSGNRKKQKNIF
jgi:hypothetical protein